ncbi:type II toxin-antitoxin system HicB family antitoxin [soil metagenome]
MTPSSEYKVVLEPLPLDEGGGFMALVPELPGCMSDGETEAEAMSNAQDAIATWISMAASKGQEPPKPMKQRY